MSDHDFCLLVRPLVLVHQFHAQFLQELLILDQPEEGRPAVEELRLFAAIVLLLRPYFFFIDELKCLSSATDA